MAEITLKDILIGARQESYRMRHFYVGTEHLFLALLSSKDSLAGNILEEYGLTSSYVIDAVRRKIGKGGKHRLWAGVPNTPRAEVLLGIANDLALEAGREEINERDLLTSIFEENDNIPVRVLAALGLTNTAELTELARDFTITSDSQYAFVKIEFGTGFDQQNSMDNEELLILRRMFKDCSQIRIERRLPKNNQETLLILTPFIDDIEGTFTVVKLDQVRAIIDEYQHYKAYAHLKLPTISARIKDKPIVLETSSLAGIQYILPDSNALPQDLNSAIEEWDNAQLERWLHRELFPVFGHHWWQKKKPHRFYVWREYDWMLPAIMILDVLKEKNPPQVSYVIRMPVDEGKIYKPGRGDMIALENFVVDQIHPEQNMLQLAAGQGTDTAKSYKIQVFGIDLSANTFYRGEVIESLSGQVRQTRRDQMIQNIQSLEPGFELSSRSLFLPGVGPGELPNPIFAHKDISDSSFVGVLSVVHGNLHPGCILANSDGSALIVDFAHIRDGHTLFDWAMLESRLLSQASPGESWDDAQTVLNQLIELNDGLSLNDLSKEGILSSIAHVRSVAQKCLLDQDDWAEYFVALAYCGLQAATQRDLPTGHRRLMFLASALAFHELQTRHPLKT